MALGFLNASTLLPPSWAECMFGVDLGRETTSWVTFLVRLKTTIGRRRSVNASLPLEGRAVPVAWIDFEYPWKTLALRLRKTPSNAKPAYLVAGTPPRPRTRLCCWSSTAAMTAWI